MLKKAAHDIFDHPQEGDLCMDVPKKSSWAELMKLAINDEKRTWRKLVEERKTKTDVNVAKPKRHNKRPQRSQIKTTQLHRSAARSSRRKNFAAAKKKLEKSLKQQKITDFFKPAKSN